MTPKEWLDRSEKQGAYAHDLLEQAPFGALNNAMTEVLHSLQSLRQVARKQQAEIERLQGLLENKGA